MFNDDIADTIQLISLPLEVIGLALALIELKSGKTAKKIIELLRSAPAYLRYKTLEMIRDNEFRIFQFLLSLGIPLIIIPVIAYLIKVVFGLERNIENDAFLWIIMIYGIAFILLITINILGILSYLLYRIIISFNAISRGKPLGAFGIFLAIIGILGEIYQVITLLSD